MLQFIHLTASQGASMNKQYAFALLFIFLLVSKNTYAQEEPKGQGSSREGHATPLDLERETLNAITFSEKLKPLSDTFCNNVISAAPEELQEDLKLYFDSSIKDSMLPSCIILHGPTGSGKSTLAEVIAQNMKMPFCIVKGSQVANEYVNSGKSGLRRIGVLAAEGRRNVIIDEFDTLAEKIEKDVEQQTSDQTCIAFWEMIDTLEANQLLFIGTTNDLRGMPEQLKSRLRGDYYEIPYQNDKMIVTSIINTSLRSTPLDTETTKNAIIDAVQGMSTRDIKKLMRLADRYARRKNHTAPIITLSNFDMARKKIRANKKIDSKLKWDGKKVFHYSVQSIGALAAVTGIIATIYSAKIATENLRLTKSTIAFNTLATLKNLQLANTNTETAIKALECAAKNVEVAKSAKTQAAIIGGAGLVIGAAGVAIAAKTAATAAGGAAAAGAAAGLCTIQ